MSLAASWGNTRALLWLLDRSYATPEEMTEALSLAIEHGNLDIAMLLVEHGANGFAHPHEKSPPLRDATSLGHIELIRAILHETKFLESHEFARSMCEAYLSSPEGVHPLFWDTCRQMTAKQYFRVLIVIQTFTSSDAWFFDNSEELYTLYQKMFDYSLTSGSAELKKIYRLSELNPGRFQEFVLLPNGTTVGLSSVDSRRILRDEILPAFYYEDSLSEEANSDAFRIILSLGGGDIEGLKEHLDVDDSVFEQPGEDWILLFFCNVEDKFLPEGLLDTVKTLLDCGANVNAVDEKGRTPLMFSSKIDDLNLIKHLIERGAILDQVDKKGQSASLHALKNKNPAALALLQKNSDINAPIMQGETPLQLMLSHCKHDMIDELRKMGARRPGIALSKNGISAPFLAEESCRTCISRLLQSSPSEQDEKSGVQAIFDDLVTRYFSGEDTHSSMTDQVLPNMKSWEDGLTPLQVAVCLNDDETVAELLSIPVDANAIDSQGFSALHYAAIRSSSSTKIGLLLSHKGDACLQDRNGRTALHLAAIAPSWRAADNVRVLLKDLGPARVDILDVDGNTALHLAIMAGAKKSVEILVFAGANPYARNNDGYTAIKLALLLAPTVFGGLIDVALDASGDTNCVLFEDGRSVNIDPFLDGQAVALLGKSVEDAELEESFDADMVLASHSNSPIKLRPVWPSKFLDPLKEDPVTEVDLYNSYDSEIWTALDGKKTFPLRPVGAMYR